MRIKLRTDTPGSKFDNEKTFSLCEHAGAVFVGSWDLQVACAYPKRVVLATPNVLVLFFIL